MKKIIFFFTLCCFCFIRAVFALPNYHNYYNVYQYAQLCTNLVAMGYSMGSFSYFSSPFTGMLPIHHEQEQDGFIVWTPSVPLWFSGDVLRFTVYNNKKAMCKYAVAISAYADIHGRVTGVPGMLVLKDDTCHSVLHYAYGNPYRTVQHVVIQSR